MIDDFRTFNQEVLTLKIILEVEERWLWIKKLRAEVEANPNGTI